MANFAQIAALSIEKHGPHRNSFPFPKVLRYRYNGVVQNNNSLQVSFKYPIKMSFFHFIFLYPFSPLRRFSILLEEEKKNQITSIDKIDGTLEKNNDWNSQLLSKVIKS